MGGWSRKDRVVNTVPLPEDAPQLHRGEHIRVTQMIVGRNGNWPTSVEGIVEAYRAEPTGSWFAQGKDDRLWLLRLHLRKPDGEVSELTLDPFTRVERLD